MISLRPYQLDMVERTRCEYRRGNRHPLDVLSTGGGKSCIAAFMAHGAWQKGRQTWFLAHRTELLHQLKKTVQKAGVPCGIVGEDFTDQPCLIGNIHTVVTRLSSLPKPGFIFCDEAHRSAGATYSSILEHHSDCDSLGLTATPQRLDGKGLKEHFDCMVHGPSMKQLVADGFLNRAEYYAPKELVDVSGLRKTAGDYNSADLEALMAKPSVTGDMVSNYARLAAGRSALVFCVTVKHAEAVAESFRLNGITAESIDGKLDAQERKDRQTRYAKGETVVLCSCDLISEGYDVSSGVDFENPRIPSCIIDGSPTQSLTKFMQRGGRVLRPGQFRVSIYLDHAGNCFRHGLLEDDREWSLEGRPRGQSCEPTIEVHRCNECYAVFQGTQCPQCGAGRKASPREVREKEGELIRIEMAAIESVKRMNIDQEKACRTFADFLAIQKRRGYSNGWAMMRWRSSWMFKKSGKDKNERQNKSTISGETPPAIGRSGTSTALCQP